MNHGESSIPDELDRWLADDLWTGGDDDAAGRSSQPPSTQTRQVRQIMGKLGFMQGTPAAGRRAMRRRYAGGAMVLCIAVLAGVAASTAYRSSPAARTPDGATVSEALDHDLQTTGAVFRNSFDALRGIVTRLEAPAAPAQEDPPASPESSPVDQSGLAPVS